MLVYLTVNQSGFIGIWFDEPKRKGNKWIAKFPFINALIYKNVKRIITETQMNWESDYITIPIN